MLRKLFVALCLQCLLLVSQWLAMPVCVHAAEPVVAVILPSSPPHLAKIHQAFQRSLAERTGGQPPPRFYLQTPNNDYMSLRNSARKAIALKVELIIAFGTEAAAAIRAEGSKIPVIFVDVLEPEAMGLVVSAGNGDRLVTGVRGNAPLQTLFKLLRELTNTLKLAVILDGDPTDKQLVAVLKDAAGRRGLEIIPVTLRGNDQPGLLRALAASGADGVLFVEYEGGYQAVLDFALGRKLPVISIVPGLAEAGALLSMESTPEEQGELLAGMVAQWLGGRSLQQIPVVVPRKIDIVINLKSAQQCDLQVPLEILSQATRLIR